MCVFLEKFFVATHSRNSIANITINSNWLQLITESPNKLASILLNEVKETTRNKHNNFATCSSSFAQFFPWPGSVYVVIRIYAGSHRAWLGQGKNKKMENMGITWTKILQQQDCHYRLKYMKKDYICPSVTESLCRYCLVHL